MLPNKDALLSWSANPPRWATRLFLFALFLVACAPGLIVWTIWEPADLLQKSAAFVLLTVASLAGLVSLMIVFAANIDLFAPAALKGGAIGTGFGLLCSSLFFGANWQAVCIATLSMGLLVGTIAGTQACLSYWRQIEKRFREIENRHKLSKQAESDRQ